MLKISYTTDGIQGEFPVPFRIFSDENIQIFLNEDAVLTGFVVQDEQSKTGARVIFSIPPEAGKTLTVLRQNEIKRVTDFQPQNPLELETLNFEFDYQVETMRDLFGYLEKCVHQDFLSSETLDLTLPTPQAGRALVWAPSEDKLVNSEINVAQTMADLSSQIAQLNALYAQIQLYLRLSGDAGILGLVNNMIELIQFYHPDAFLDFERIAQLPDETPVYGLVIDAANEIINYD